jgi:hypothetical protein
MSEDLTPPEFACAVSMSCPSVTRLEDGDLTPEHLKCGIASCPSATAFNGQLVIVGKRADQVAQQLGKGVGPDEYAVVIDPDLLEIVFTQWLEARNG